MIISLDATQRSVPMFIRGMAEDAGLDVVFGSDPGYQRDSHTIYLPAYARFTPAQLASDPSVNAMQQAVSELFMATGFHEFGHPAYTTPGHRNPGDLGDFLWNSLEDVRCDSIQQRRFAGAKRIFNAGYSRLIRMGFWKPCDASDPQGAFTSWVLYQGRALLAEQECFRDLGAHSEAVLQSLTDQFFVRDAWAIVSKVRSASSTKDVFDIVNELLAFLKQQSAQQQPQSSDQGSKSEPSNDASASNEPAQGSDPGKDQSSQKKQQQADASSAGTKSQSPQTSESSTNAQDQASSQGSAQQPSAGAGSDTKPSPGNGATGTPPSSDQPSSGTSSGSAQPTGSDPAKVAQAVLNASRSSLPKDVGSVLSQALDGATRDAAMRGAESVKVPRARRAVASHSSYIGDGDARVLTIRLRNLLLAQSRSHKSFDRRGSRACPRMLARLSLGEREVFVDEKKAKLVDTAVKLLVDRSQSMQGRRIQVAREAALRVSIALGDIPGTNVSASAFPERLDGRDDQVRQLLPFGAKPRQFSRNFLDLDAPDWAMTPMAPALMLAMYELLRQRQPRKVCLVVTDGAPNGGGVLEKAVLAEMRRAGIQVFGLGIGKMHCPDLFDKYEVVEDLTGLEPAMFRLLQSSMLSRVAA